MNHWMMVFGISIFIISIEYMLYYIFDQKRNQKIDSVIMCLPALILGFCVILLMINPVLGFKNLIAIFRWCEVHHQVVVNGSILAGIFLWSISIWISLTIYHKRDYI